jgi:ATP-dependent DNA helicase RecG
MNTDAEKTRIKNILIPKGIDNLYKLHRWFPIRYIDCSKETGASSALNGMHAVIIGTIMSVRRQNMKKRNGKYDRYWVKDRMTGQMFGVTLFCQKYAKQTGRMVLVSGILSYSPDYGISVNPDASPNGPMFTYDIKGNMRIIPVFSQIKGISSNNLNNIIQSSLRTHEDDTVPEKIRQYYKLPEINDALYMKNYPKNMAEVYAANTRLLFDDLFYIASHFALSERKNNQKGVKIESSKIADSLITCLPYKLTADQYSAYEAIKAKMMEGTKANALIQGDVGSGKTIVAFLSMILASENGFQSILIAPTKILAKQHFEKITAFIQNTGLKAALICGNVNKKMLGKIANGQFDILIGTSSLTSSNMHFHNPGIVIVDEEHRFGVEQREAINNRFSDIGMITMSATPIPRSLAQAMYGEFIQIIDIKTKPAGRKPVITRYDNGTHIRDWVNFVLASKKQIYVVCPAIDTDAEMMENILTVKKASDKYKKMFPNTRIKVLTGETDSAQTDNTISQFKNGEIDILISTTVIEVGVDIPNASLIIIENAERFGLAGMHQLRGRVGRGDSQGYCLLVSQDTGNERIKLLCTTNDGFEISRIDMEMFRKPGCLSGTVQSGYNRYVEEMLLYPDNYKHILNLAKQLSPEILEAHMQKMSICDPGKHNKAIHF